MKLQPLAAVALAIGLAACGRTETAEAPAEATPAAPVSAPAQRAVALLRGADGDMAGTATVVAADSALTITIAAEALPAGVHGVHIHSVGKCEGPTFESAGPHWNPMDVKHGLKNPDGQHAGDMPNLTAGADGRGVLEYTLIASSLDALLDADGAAFVVHAKADDQKTDPSGDSGDRIACGVFSRG